MTEDHTGVNIASVLSKIFMEWEIESKIVTVVSDNGANIKNAIHEHLKKRQHPCIAHTLNLCVTEATNSNEAVLKLVKKCRTIVGHFKHSVSASEKLKSMEIQMGLP